MLDSVFMNGNAPKLINSKINKELVLSYTYSIYTCILQI